MILPTLVTKQSGYVGEQCAYCKQPFNPGDLIVSCPVDGVLQHTWCWRENNDRCAGFGCRQQGPILMPLFADSANTDTNAPRPIPPRSTLRTIPIVTPPDADSAESPPPSRSLRFAQSCVLIAIAIAIILMSISCFGLWLIAEQLYRS